MIRVLHFAGIINRYDFIDMVLTRLDRSRFEVSALTGIPARRAGAYAEGEEYPTRILNFEFNRRNYPRMLLALVKEIRRFRPHILQSHHYDESIIASIAVRIARVPCYVIGHHYSDHIYYLSRGIKQKALLAAENFCNRTATRIVVPAQEVAHILTKRQGVPDERVEVIPYGLDFSGYRPSSPDAPLRLRREHDLIGKYMILTCCRLSQEKGLEHLLQAVPKVKSRRDDFRLVMVGDGPYEHELRRWSRELGIDDVVKFIGWRNDALDWMAAADLVIQPSLCESFCQVLIEGLAFGKPVVMTPVGAAPEVIGNNERGRLVPPGDSNAFASAINELMADRELGSRLAESGRVYVCQNMEANLTARRYEHVYEAALKAASLSELR